MAKSVVLAADASRLASLLLSRRQLGQDPRFVARARQSCLWWLLRRRR